jgi:ribosomal subunit interface protein
MSPRIMCHHHSLNEIDREFITNKVEGLKKYFDRISDISVILDAAKNESQAELLVFGAHINLRVKETAPDMRTAFEGALNKAERLLSKTKDKKWGGKKHGRRNVTIRRLQASGLEPEVAPMSRAGEAGESVAGLVTVEHVEPQVMSLEEAEHTMVSHKNGMFVFINQKTDEVNILHRNAADQMELLELTGTVLFHPPSAEVMEVQQ